MGLLSGLGTLAHCVIFIAGCIYLFSINFIFTACMAKYFDVLGVIIGIIIFIIGVVVVHDTMNEIKDFLQFVLIVSVIELPSIYLFMHYGKIVQTVCVLVAGFAPIVWLVYGSFKKEKEPVYHLKIQEVGKIKDKDDNIVI